ncbi:hypothetical protein ONZ45_g9946 [Pleurotus djamor]|nr:hypothetical protein ONZ45_g9946 [Pleurotus djamor]
MAPRDKVCAAQKSFLEGWVDAYLEGKKASRLDKVWDKLFPAWFQKWPVMANMQIVDVMEREKLHGQVVDGWKKYIKRWFQNHAVPCARGLPIYDFVEKYLKLHATRGRRAPQLLQFYCKKYTSHIHPIVEAKIAALPAKPTSSERLSIVHEATVQCYEKEGDQEKQMIQAEFNKAKADLAVEVDTTPTPHSYAEAIKDLPSHFKGFAQLLGTITGWKFTLLAGGPDPRNGGRINTIAVHYGQNHAGATWGAMPNFKENVAAPFSAFLNSVYTPAECASRAFKVSQGMAALEPSIPNAAEVLTPSLTPSNPVVPNTPIVPVVPVAPVISIAPTEFSGHLFPPNVANTASTIPTDPNPVLLSLLEELHTPLPSDFIDPSGSDFFDIDFTVGGGVEGGVEGNIGGAYALQPTFPEPINLPPQASTIVSSTTTPGATTNNTSTNTLTEDALTEAVNIPELNTTTLYQLPHDSVANESPVSPVETTLGSAAAKPASTGITPMDLNVVNTPPPAAPLEPLADPPRPHRQAYTR